MRIKGKKKKGKIKIVRKKKGKIKIARNPYVEENKKQKDIFVL